MPSFLPLLGTWTGLERHEASPAGPATTARASLVLKLDVAATLVVQDYRRVQADGAELSGHGVFRAEPGSAAVLWWFFDSTGAVPPPARGHFAGDALVLEQPLPWGRARHHLQAAGDRLDHRVEQRPTGSRTWATLAVGVHRRVSGH